MQYSQIGGGAISPVLAAHIQKNSQQSTAAQGQSPAATTVGGGIISPQVARHIKQQQVGGGWIHPLVARHIHA